MESRWRLANSVTCFLQKAKSSLNTELTALRAAAISASLTRNSGSFPTVEIPGVAAHGVIAVLLDVVEHGAHAIGKGAVVLPRLGFGLLEVVDH